jgi:hypothetical protein
MKIEVSKTYTGGKNGALRRVLREGAAGFIVWGDPRDNLPLGGHHGYTRCTTVKSFENWASAIAP